MKIQINQTVVSSKFGTGTVLELSEAKATIQFENETKSLLVKFAGLTDENGNVIVCDYVAPVVEVSVRKKRVSKTIFATVEDLKEYKGLIIYYINKFSYSPANVSLKNVMNLLLQSVNNNEVSAKSTRGIKGAITRKATSITLLVSEENLRNKNGLSITDNGARATSLLENFNQFKLNNL